MEEFWGTINRERWRDTPVVAGRCGTEEDVKSGRAVFFVQGFAEPAAMPLPRAALQRLEDGSTQYVVAIQAERIEQGVAVGIRPLSGGNGVCMEDELQFLPDFPDENRVS